MNDRPLVSIVVPTLNSSSFLDACLGSIREQTYQNIEVIVVDNNSHDNTKDIAEKFNVRFFLQGPDQSRERVFGAPFQRNFGFRQANGEYVYYVDVDMTLPKGLIAECVEIMRSRPECKGIVIPEESFGVGFWAKCKWLERRTYWGDDLVEAPRFFKKRTVEKFGYLDASIGADDWDLALRLQEAGHVLLRSKNYIMHNEGNLTLGKLLKKRFLYGKDILKFKQKHGGRKFFLYFTPVRKAYLRNIPFLLSHPILFCGMIVMRACEYAGGGAGILYRKIFMGLA